MTLNKKVIYTAIAVAAVAIIIVILSQKQKTMNYTSGMEHSSDMNHSINSADHTITRNSNSVLSEAGTDPFAVIQEAIALLEANSDTDWSAVNIEALRSHLVEMQDMTLNVTVEQQPINLGFMAAISESWRMENTINLITGLWRQVRILILNRLCSGTLKRPISTHNYHHQST
jgi:hypothetical protein